MTPLILNYFCNKEKKHEVFLSFRGEDTRKTFVSHLYGALQRANINTYIDWNLERGDEISKTLLKAIEDSQLSVIVFSQNFANSTWCLDEVRKIMKCKKRGGQIVVPIFYRIEPSEVRNLTGTYETAFATHERKFKCKLKIRKWRKALKDAAGLAGVEFSVSNDRCEYITVEEIAMDVLKKLNHVYASDLDEKIEKYQQQAKCQKQYYDANPNPIYWRNYQEVVETIRKVQLEREARLHRTRQIRFQ